MRTTAGLAGIAATLACALALVGCAGGDDAAARRRLVVYSPHGADILRDFERSFETAYPEIDVVTFDMGATAILDRVRGERARPQGDVWWGAPRTTLMQAARDGLLAPYRPSFAAQLAAGDHDPADHWYGTLRLPIVLGYNPATCPEDSLPKTWDEVPTAPHRGRIVLRHPLESGTMTTLFTARLAQSLAATGSTDAGRAWLSALDACTASYQPNPQAMYDAVCNDPRGRFTLWGLSDILGQANHPDHPLPFAWRPLTGGTPVILDGIAILAGARNPDDARLFYEHVTSKESLLFLARSHYKIPVARGDLDPAELPEWMRASVIEPLELDWDLIAARTPEWMNDWDMHIESRGELR